LNHSFSIRYILLLAIVAFISCGESSDGKSSPDESAVDRSVTATEGYDEMAESYYELDSRVIWQRPELVMNVLGPLEEMTITIGADMHVTFTGDFTFDYIPDGNCFYEPCPAVDKMQFPLPPINASNIAVYQDGVPLPWSMSTDTYPTVLPEFPNLDMFEWSGPFPVDGAVFTVEYEHDIFTRESEWIFFYSLGTGKYFPTYDKITTALLDIYLPGGVRELEINLDEMPVDPSLYTISGNKLSLTLTSEYGPFTKDLIVSFQVPVPGPIWLLGIGLAGIVWRQDLRKAGKRVATRLS